MQFTARALVIAIAVRRNGCQAIQSPAQNDEHKTRVGLGIGKTHTGQHAGYADQTDTAKEFASWHAMPIR